jgi:hypothetical protein
MITELTLIPGLLAGETALNNLAAQVAPLVFRTELTAPGFALLDLGIGLSPHDFRDLVIRLGQALARYYHQHFGARLHFVSVSRFDQQSPTRPHRDGGPDASILLLGYEPTEVDSRVWLLDYTRAAVERGLTPQAFLDCCNPAFGGDEKMLFDHTTEVTGFTPGHDQILLVNNSNLDVSDRSQGMLGVLHHAVIAAPRPDRSRWIDSVLMGITPEGLDDGALRAFVEEAKAATR